MSYVLTEAMEGHVIEVTVSGKLTKQAYLDFVPLVDAAITKYGSVRIIFITLGFQGWTAGALWEDIKFDLRHFSHIERLAIVGETKWEQEMSVFCRPFTTAVVKYFEHSEVFRAREWIREDL